MFPCSPATPSEPQDVEQLLYTLTECGINLSVQGESLSVQGPANLVDQFRPAIRQAKADIITHLTTPQETKPSDWRQAWGGNVPADLGMRLVREAESLFPATRNTRVDIPDRLVCHPTVAEGHGPDICPKCKSDHWYDVETRRGNVRRDCRRCGTFLNWVTWQGSGG